LVIKVTGGLWVGSVGHGHLGLRGQTGIEKHGHHNVTRSQCEQPSWPLQLLVACGLEAGATATLACVGRCVQERLGQNSESISLIDHCISYEFMAWMHWPFTVFTVSGAIELWRVLTLVMSRQTHINTHKPSCLCCTRLARMGAVDALDVRHHAHANAQTHTRPPQAHLPPLLH